MFLFFSDKRGPQNNGPPGGPNFPPRLSGPPPQRPGAPQSVSGPPPRGAPPPINFARKFRNPFMLFVRFFNSHKYEL